MQCGCMNCCFVVKAPANTIMQCKQRQLGHKQFWHVLQIDCCAAIHGRIWMNNVPNESQIIMLSCTEISFIFFRFWEIWSQTRVSCISLPISVVLAIRNTLKRVCKIHSCHFLFRWLSFYKKKNCTQNSGTSDIRDAFNVLWQNMYVKNLH